MTTVTILMGSDDEEKDDNGMVDSMYQNPIFMGVYTDPQKAAEVMALFQEYTAKRPRKESPEYAEWWAEHPAMDIGTSFVRDSYYTFDTPLL